MRIIILKTNPSSKTRSHERGNIQKKNKAHGLTAITYQTQVLNPPCKDQGTTSARLGLVPLERPNAPQWLRCRCVRRWDHRRRPVTHPPRHWIQNELPSAKLLFHPWGVSVLVVRILILFFFERPTPPALENTVKTMLWSNPQKIGNI